MTAKILVLDPLTLIGREFLGYDKRLGAIVGELEFRHTALDDEHQIAKFGDASALAPPLTSASDLEGSSAVVTLGDRDSDCLDHLEDFLDAAPETVLVDAGDDGLVFKESESSGDTAAPAYDEPADSKAATDN